MERKQTNVMPVYRHQEPQPEIPVGTALLFVAAMQLRTEAR